MTPVRLTEIPSASTITDLADTTNLPLARRVRSAVNWNVSSSLIEQLISFARSVVLARILVPEDFGLFGIFNNRGSIERPHDDWVRPNNRRKQVCYER
jgi:hypothetical protein